MTLSNTDFTYVRDLVRDRSAISLDESKMYLVEARLKPLAHELQLELPGVVSELRRDPAGPLSRRVVEAMTTHETSWLRDIHPFEALRSTVIPAVAEARTDGPITIWSAACSSGQEPYGIAMILFDEFPELRHRIRVIATDISVDILEKAKDGRYTQLEVNRGMAATMLTRHFARDGALWRVNDSIRSMVEFREHNLVGSYRGIPPADIVLLRNVLIYFELEVKQQVLSEVSRVLRPDGWLLLGSAETAVGIDGSWTRSQIGRTTFYRPSTAVDERQAS